MAQITGTALLDQLTADLGVTTLSTLVKQVLAVRLDQMQAANVYSDTQIAVVLGATPLIRQATPEGQVPLTYLTSAVATAKQEISQDPGSNPLSGLAEAQSNSIPGYSATASFSTPYVNTLDSGAAWAQAIVSYSFNTSIPAEYWSDPALTDGWRSLDSSEKYIVRSIMASIDPLIGLDFQEVPGNGDIRFNVVDMDPDVAAFALYPGNAPEAGDVFLGFNDPTTAYGPGDYGYSTIVHELGHALGLKHPFEDGATLPASLDNTAFSLMSYTDYRTSEFHATWNAMSNRVSYLVESTANATNFSLLDVQTLHAIYGPESSAHTGNDTYTMAEGGYLTLWDAGGVDTLDFSNAQGDCRIELESGNLSTVNQQPVEDIIAKVMADLVSQGASDAGFRNWISQEVTANYSDLYNGENSLGITQGAIIENVFTGSGSDTLWDNSVDNLIRAGAGDDIIYLGAGGFDDIDGGTGYDKIIFGFQSTDTQRQTQADGSVLLVGRHLAVQMDGIEALQFTDGLITLA